MLGDAAVFWKALMADSSIRHEQGRHFASSVELLLPSNQKASLATPLQSVLCRG